jgi:hypothetical protein
VKFFAAAAPLIPKQIVSKHHVQGTIALYGCFGVERAAAVTLNK